MVSQSAFTAQTVAASEAIDYLFIMESVYERMYKSSPTLLISKGYSLQTIIVVHSTTLLIKSFWCLE